MRTVEERRLAAAAEPPPREDVTRIVVEFTENTPSGPKKTVITDPKSEALAEWRRKGRIVSYVQTHKDGTTTCLQVHANRAYDLWQKTKVVTS